MRRRLLSWMIAGVFLGACGGSNATTEEEGAEPTAGSEEPGVAWADMTGEQRGQYMAEVVVPRMRPMFQEFDAEEFASFGCATCHGENAHDVSFHMPNGLHPLDPEALPAMFQSEDPEVQRVAQFMGQVVPAMAELLGREPYDPATHEGFGCFGCHATAE